MSTDNTDRLAEIVVLPTRHDGMTTKEKVYTGIVMACASLLVIPLLAIHVMIIPSSENPAVLYFVTAILWTGILSVAITSGINLYYHSVRHDQFHDLLLPRGNLGRLSVVSQDPEIEDQRDHSDSRIGYRTKTH